MLKAGTARFSTRNVLLDKSPAVETTVTVRTNSFFDKVYRMRDTLQSYTVAGWSEESGDTGYEWGITGEKSENTSYGEGNTAYDWVWSDYNWENLLSKLSFASLKSLFMSWKTVNPSQKTVNASQKTVNPTWNDGNITWNDGNITCPSRNTTLISGNTTRISGNTTRISGNPTRISGNTTCISGNPTRISGWAGCISGWTGCISGWASCILGCNSYISGNTTYRVGNTTQISGKSHQMTTLGDCKASYISYISGNESRQYESIKPLYHVRKLHEGNYEYIEEIFYLAYGKDCSKVRVIRSNEEGIRFDKVLTTDNYGLDILTILIFTQNLDFPNMQDGQVIHITNFFGKEKINVSAKLNGREYVEDERNNKHLAYKLNIDVSDKAFRNTKNAMEIWISADSNRLPLKLKAKLKIGAAEALIVSYNKQNIL
jgi:hypothetical protein